MKKQTGWHEVVGIEIKEMEKEALKAERLYGDIISRTRPVSKRHRPMPSENRAVQFSPFAALTGYEDIIDETGRLTETKNDPDDEIYEKLDRILQAIMQKDEEDRNVKLRVFVPDELKDGGKYSFITGHIKRIDSINRKIILSEGIKVPVDMIVDIEPFSR